MHYLASALKGRALDSIGNIAITADNFPIAWETLTKRFENKHRLLASHFSTLLGLPFLTKESASDLQSLVDKVNISVSSLKNLDRSPSDLWNDFLVHLCVQKLDPAVRKAWNLKTCDSDIPPTFEDLTKFLATRIRALEEGSNSPSQKGGKTSSSPRVTVATASATASSACPLCKAKHSTRALSLWLRLRLNAAKQSRTLNVALTASVPLTQCKIVKANIRAAFATNDITRCCISSQNLSQFPRLLKRKIRRLKPRRPALK